MSDLRDDIDADFISPALSRDPREFDAYRETLRIVDRMVSLLERVIDENGVK